MGSMTAAVFFSTTDRSALLHLTTIVVKLSTVVVRCVTGEPKSWLSYRRYRLYLRHRWKS
jgi:hypothetical protein